MHRLILLTFAFLGLLFAISDPARAASDPDTSDPGEGKIEEGVVEFDIDYEDVGAMASFMPKAGRIAFRPGQMRSELGDTVILLGVEEERQIQLMEIAGRQAAFSLPLGGMEGAEDLRVEVTEEGQELAGVQGRRAYLVDIRDPSNRLPLLLADRIEASWQRIHPDLSSFALEFSRPIGEGLGHWRATALRREKLADELFEVPEGFERFELESADEIASKVRELLGGQGEVQVLQ